MTDDTKPVPLTEAEMVQLAAYLRRARRAALCSSSPREANYRIVAGETTAERLVIRDVGPHDQYRTVTNDAERVVAELYASGALADGRRLFYYDSLGALDELIHDQGVFKGFLPGRSD